MKAPPSYIIDSEAYKTLQTRTHPQDFEVIKKVLRKFEKDLTPAHGFFTASDFDSISRKAAALFMSELILIGPEALSSEDIHHSWFKVQQDFMNNYWGFKKNQVCPIDYKEPNIYDFEEIQNLPLKPTPKVNYKDAFFYIWSVIQSLVITKCLILIFGNELAKDDTLQNRLIFGIVILISFGSLFLFAWIRRKKKYY